MGQPFCLFEHKEKEQSRLRIAKGTRSSWKEW